MPTPILLLHGALGSVDQLSGIAQSLSAGYEVHTFDFYGHGCRTSEGTFSMTLFASQLEKYIQEHQLAKPDIFGYSMGGYVALYLASQKPGLLGRILTLGTKFQWTSDYAVRETGKL